MTNGENGDGDGLSGVAKVLGGGLTALIAILTALGATTGELQRFLLNAGTEAIRPFVLAILAVGFGLAASTIGNTKTRRDMVRVGLLLLGILAFCGSMWLAVQTQIKSIGQNAGRPSIAATWKSTSNSAPVLQATAKTSALKAGQRQLTVVSAVLSRRQLFQDRRRIRLYFASISSDPDGRAEQELEVVVPDEAAVVEVSSSIDTPPGNCSQTERMAEIVPYRTENKDTSCVVILVPKKSSPTG
jgi:hypothetical protein